MEPQSPKESTVEYSTPIFQREETEKLPEEPVAESKKVEVTQEVVKKITEDLAIVRAGFFYRSVVYRGVNELEIETRKTRNFIFTCAWCNAKYMYEYMEDPGHDPANVDAVNRFIALHRGCTCQLIAKVTITHKMASGFCLKKRVLFCKLRNFQT